MFPGAMETNLSPTSLFGTTVTADATAHTKGSPAELIASTGADAEGVWVAAVDVAVSNADTSMLLDLMTGGAGSEVVLVPDLDIGYAQEHITSFIGQIRFIPVSIAAGTRLSARIQALTGSDTAVVAVWLAQSVQHLNGASSVEAVGVDAANSRGTSVASGTDAWGAWTSIGTISADRNLFMPNMDGFGDTTFAAGDRYSQLVQIGYGTNAPDAGGTAIDAIWRFGQSGQEAIAGPFPCAPAYADLSSGETLWARIATGDAEDPRGIVIHAMEAPAAAGGGDGLALPPSAGKLIVPA